MTEITKKEAMDAVHRLLGTLDLEGKKDFLKVITYIRDLSREALAEKKQGKSEGGGRTLEESLRVAALGRPTAVRKTTNFWPIFIFAAKPFSQSYFPGPVHVFMSRQSEAPAVAIA